MEKRGPSLLEEEEEEEEDMSSPNTTACMGTFVVTRT